MKQKCIWRYLLMVCVAAFMAQACTEDEVFNSESNNGTIGTLSYEWSEGQDGDTVYLYCNQILTYTMNKNQTTITPKAVVKLWPENPIIEYAAGMSPVPRYQSSSYDKSYGANPRRRIIHQQTKLHDGEILHAEISYDLYSYQGYTREVYFPHIEIRELMFANAEVESVTGYQKAKVTFNVPWVSTDNSIDNDTEAKTITVSYLKKRVQEVDVVLSTSYNTDIRWTGINTFQLYVDKNEVWQIAGDKTTSYISPELPFNLVASANKSIDAEDFDFSFKRQTSQTSKQSVGNTEWQIKRSYTTQTLMYSNGAVYFEDKFTYPLYEATITIDGKQFEFDLGVGFNVVNNITPNGQNVSTATVTFASKTFTDDVITTINKIENIPAPIIGRGQIIYYSVTAVFDQTEVEKNGNITKKCVLVKYEKGYEWGICAYEDDFPSSFTYTETAQGAFNSAAKRTVKDAFELARVAETESAILWYDGENAEISGISGLECFILGWKNKYNNKFSSKIDSYTAKLSSDKYTLTLTSPNGVSHVFDSKK